MYIYKDQIVRLKKLLSEKDLSLPQLSKLLGFANPTTMYNYYNGKSRLPEKIVDKLCKLFPDVSRDWLLNGYGDMYSNVNASTKSVIEALKLEIEALKHKIDEKDKVINNLSEIVLKNR